MASAVANDSTVTAPPKSPRSESSVASCSGSSPRAATVHLGASGGAGLTYRGPITAADRTPSGWSHWVSITAGIGIDIDPVEGMADTGLSDDLRLRAAQSHRDARASGLRTAKFYN